jgi:hypothetical protein
MNADEFFNHISTIFPDYKNNQEYRKCIRSFFNMNCEPITEFDEESNDEMNYDMESTIKGMDIIYQKIKSNELFKRIFIKAANKMLSEDPEIGFSILFCYDFFAHFHACLCTYLNAPELFNEDYETYKLLLNTL